MILLGNKNIQLKYVSEYQYYSFYVNLYIRKYLFSNLIVCIIEHTILLSSYLRL